MALGRVIKHVFSDLLMCSLLLLNTSLVFHLLNNVLFCSSITQIPCYCFFFYYNSEKSYLLTYIDSSSLTEHLVGVFPITK